jgi:hypothetical protein
MSVRHRLLSSTFLCSVSGVVVATLSAQVAHGGSSLADAMDQAAYASAASRMPAVDGINGKVAPLGGFVNRRSIYGAEGSLQFPLGSLFGLQFDPRVGRVGGHSFGELGTHFFWRNPAVGLFGLYVNHVHLNEFGGAHATTVAAEGEGYWDRWTLQGIVGVEFGNSATSASSATSSSSSSTPVTNGILTTTIVTTTTVITGYDVKTRFTDHINLKYYLTDNWTGFIGHRYQGGKHAAAFGSEVVIPLDSKLSTTAFVEARLGEKSFDGVWGGMKFYFGHHGKSLSKRHRENDDPYNYTGLPTLFNSATTSSTSSTSTSSTLTCDPGEIPDASGTACIGGETEK